MSEWKAKRFWNSASVVEQGEGFSVELDGRAVKTPAKAALVLPSRAMAGAVAAEWDAQEEVIVPTSMPVTRAANAAIDKVTHQHREVADMVAGYGDSDLLCYRADGPEELVTRQAKAWDPLLDWADKTYGARLLPVEGVMHAPQDPGALEKLAAPVHAMTPFQLTAFHDLVGISGSLVLGLAAIRDHLSAEELWALSRVDESWQQERWGVDEEAAEIAERKKNEFCAAKRFYDLCAPDS